MIPEQGSRLELVRPDDTDNPAHFMGKVQVSTGPAVWLSDSKGTQVTLTGKRETRCKEFFNNLETLALISNYTSRPIWGKVNGGTYSTMLFEAMNSLVYGAQGLVFSDLEIPQDSSQSSGEGGKVPVTPVSPFESVMNRVKQLEGVFLSAKTIDVRHYLWSNTSENAGIDSTAFYAELKDTMGPLIKIEGAASDPACTTIAHLALMPMKSRLSEKLFEEELIDFLVIVNQDISKTQRFRLTLNPYYSVYEVSAAKIVNVKNRSKNTLIESLVTPSNGVIERSIAPGHALVLRWK